MIVNTKISGMITHELDRLMKIEHRPYYKMAKVDIYTGRLFQDEAGSENKNVPTVWRKVFVPDVVTKETCVRINKILQYGRDPHPASHGFERQRDLDTFIHPHRDKRRLLTLSLLDAFIRIGKKRIKSIGRNLLGLEPAYAAYLGELMTMRGRMAGGNPLSPQILNIQAYKTDRYLTEFSAKYNLTYTRFLDAFAFSADAFIHTEVIAKIKRIISRCGWLINNEEVDIQSGNHFHLAGQIIVPAHIAAKRSGQENEPQTNRHRYPQLNKGRFGSMIRNINVSSRKEQGLIQSLKSQVNRNPHNPGKKS